MAVARVHDRNLHRSNTPRRVTRDWGFIGHGGRGPLPIPVRPTAPKTPVAPETLRPGGRTRKTQTPRRRIPSLQRGALGPRPPGTFRQKGPETCVRGGAESTPPRCTCQAQIELAHPRFHGRSGPWPTTPGASPSRPAARRTSMKSRGVRAEPMFPQGNSGDRTWLQHLHSVSALPVLHASLGGRRPPWAQARAAARVPARLPQGCHTCGSSSEKSGREARAGNGGMRARRRLRPGGCLQRWRVRD